MGIGARYWSVIRKNPVSTSGINPGLYIVINRENVDCVLRAGELTDQSLIARRIALLQMVTCAAPSYLARYGEPRHPTDLGATTA